MERANLMLAAILNVPETDPQWDTWAWNHRMSHDQIREALAKRGISVVDYQLDPISPTDTTGFLQRNAQAHIEMNNAIGLPSQDLQDVDLGDRAQKQSWISLHWAEHQDAEIALGIGS